MEKLPKFKSAQEEAEFWETHSPLDFPGEFEEVKEPIVDRRARKKDIYIRIDPEAIDLARTIGAELGIGYQTLFRMWIMEGLSRNPTARPTVGELLKLIGAMSSEERRLLSSLLQREEAKIRSVGGQHGGSPSYPS